MGRFRNEASRTASGVLTTALAVAVPALDGVPLPGVKAALGAILEILRGIDKTNQNQETLERLQDNVLQLSRSVIEPLSKKSASQVSGELRGAVDSLTHKLRQCSEEWRKRPKRTWLVRFLHRDKDDGDLQNFSRNIQEAIQVFKLHAIVRQELIGGEIKERLDMMRDETYYRDIDRILEGLDPAKQAGFLSGRPGAPTTCFEGTRKKVLGDIRQWMELADPTRAPPLLWLEGIAGVGKSTVAQTVATGSQGSWIASFFCSRQDVALRDSSRILPSIAYQLAHLDNRLKQAIGDSLAKHRAVASESLQRQLDKLLLEPLRRLDITHPPILIILDALDECEDRGPAEILRLIMTAASKQDFPVGLKILVTSRPEQHIRLAFKKPGRYHVITLHDTEKDTVQGDIADYLAAKLREIPERLGLDLEDSWVTQRQEQILVERSGGLFMAATTMLRFIGDDRVNDPRNQLRILLGLRKSPPGANLHAQLDEVYLQVLESSVASTLNKQDIIDRFQEVVGSIVLLRDPISVSALERLLDLGQGEVKAALSHLQSVIITPTSNEQAPRIYHPSFREFITSSDRCSNPDFFVTEADHEARLALRCLKLMNTRLRRDITGIESHPKKLLEEAKIREALPDEVEYACRYWGPHLVKAKKADANLKEELTAFAKRTLLWWVEAMSLLGGVQPGMGPLRGAQQSALSLSCSEDVATILGDAYRFLHVHFNALDATPSAVYHSVLHFPKETALYKAFKDVKKDTRNALYRLPSEPHADGIWSVRFSPDGSWVVSGSVDRSVIVWDAKTGAQKVRMDGHTDWVMSVGFCPQGSRVASASHDKTARIWNASTGKQIHVLKHPAWVNSVSFSPDGLRLGTGAEDGYTRLWNTSTGEMLAEVVAAECGPVTTVTFSPRGSYFASSFFDGSVHIWTADLKNEVSTLVGHSNTASGIAFSPDDTRLVSGAWDLTGRVWDARTGEHLLTLEGHALGFNGIAWAPDGTRVGSVADDNTVRMWDALTGKEIGTVGEHGHWTLGVDFSPDSKRVVSCAWDGTIVVWNAVTFEKIAELQTLMEGSKRHEEQEDFGHASSGQGMLGGATDQGNSYLRIDTPLSTTRSRTSSHSTSR